MGLIQKLNFKVIVLQVYSVSSIKLNLKIQNQHLLTSEFDGVVCVNNEEIYNNMNQAMCSFNKSLFIVGHKSFYSDVDIQILDESLTLGDEKAPTQRDL